MDNFHEQGSYSATRPMEDNSKDMECPICQEKTTNTCSACKSVAYCSIDHQKLDGNNHQKVCQCQPFLIQQTGDMGLGWFATRDLDSGSLLLEEDPVIQVPAWTLDGDKLCTTCGILIHDSMRTCSTCFWPVCSDQCEKHPLHKGNECMELTSRKLKYPPPPNWTCGLLICCIRANLLKARSPEKFKQLMALQNALHGTPWTFEQLPATEFPPGMHEALSGPICLDRNEVRKLLLILHVNNFKGQSTPGQQSLSHGSLNRNICCYLKASRLNHSCSPNCTAFVGPAPANKLRIRTAAAVSKETQLTINYYDYEALKSTDFRQIRVWRDGFICKCKRCLDPTELGTFLSGIKCFNCSSHLTSDSDKNDNVGFLVPLDPLDEIPPLADSKEFECHRCHVQVPFFQIKETFPNALKVFILRIKRLTCAEPIDPKTLDLVLTQYENDPEVNGYLHKNHWIIQGAMRKFIKAQMDILETMTKEELDRLVKRLEVFLSMGNKLYPGVLIKPRYEDSVRLNKTAAVLMGRFGNGMSIQKREKLTQICHKAEMEQLAFLTREIDSEMDKVKIAEALKLASMLQIEKQRARSIDNCS